MMPLSTPYRRKNGIIGSFVVLVVGAIFLIIGLKMRANFKNFKETRIPAEATVINLISHRSSKSTTFQPELEYTTNDGKTIQVVHTTGSNPPQYKVGDKVKIYYAPDNPYSMIIDSKSEQIFPLIFIILGGACCLVFPGTLLSSIKRFFFRA